MGGVKQGLTQVSSNGMVTQSPSYIPKSWGWEELENWSWYCTPVVSALERLRQEDPCKTITTQ